jgi:hypothetical protein
MKVKRRHSAKPIGRWELRRSTGVVETLVNARESVAVVRSIEAEVGGRSVERRIHQGIVGGGRVRREGGRVGGLVMGQRLRRGTRVLGRVI